jgi:excisionase family DNA binding protein
MDTYTIPEAAAAARVSPKEIRTWIEEGRLNAFEVAGRRHVRRAELEQLLSVTDEPSQDVGGLSSRIERLESEVSELSAELEEVRQRLDDPEDADDARARRSSMRPALIPLFAPRDSDDS